MRNLNKNTTNLGLLGESIAVKYLTDKGFNIIERNYAVHNVGEIDIIAIKNEVFHFIEVKTSHKRLLSDTFHSVRKFNLNKKEKLKKMMHLYSYKKKIMEIPRCLDLVGISVSCETKQAVVAFEENIYFEDY